MSRNKPDTCPKCRNEIDYEVIPSGRTEGKVTRHVFKAIHKTDIATHTALVFPQGISVSYKRELRTDLARDCRKEPAPRKTCPECKRSASKGHSGTCSRRHEEIA